MGRGLLHGAGPSTWGGAFYMGRGLLHGAGPYTCGGACIRGWGVLIYGGGAYTPGFMVYFTPKNTAIAAIACIFAVQSVAVLGAWCGPISHH